MTETQRVQYKLLFNKIYSIYKIIELCTKSKSQSEYKAGSGSRCFLPSQRTEVKTGKFLFPDLKTALDQMSFGFSF